MYGKLRQHLTEIVIAGRHAIPYDFLMQVLCISGFQRDIIGSNRHIRILRQNPDTALLRVEVIDKYECRMRGIRSPNIIQYNKGLNVKNPKGGFCMDRKSHLLSMAAERWRNP